MRSAKQSYGSNGNSSFVASAVVTPNSSVLSEEAFQELGRFGEDSLDVSETEYESQDEAFSENEVVDEEELVISKLGLPRKLVETLEARGISELFPIQVRFFGSPFSYFYILFSIWFDFLMELV